MQLTTISIFHQSPKQCLCEHPSFSFQKHDVCQNGLESFCSWSVNTPQPLIMATDKAAEVSHNLVDTEMAESLIKVKSHKCKMISSGLQLWLRSALKNIKLTQVLVTERGKSLVMDFAVFWHLIGVLLSVGSFYPHPRHRNSSGHQTNMSENVFTSANVYGCTELDKE